MEKIAVIFTCHNRKEKTLRCIKSLLQQENMPKFMLYVCDDGSTDGTDQAIMNAYPNSVIIYGNGNLFWSRGMHKAMSAAVKENYDLYLMVNDDVEFFPAMWETMYQAYLDNMDCGIVGCTISASTGKQSYGGANFIIDKSGDYVGSMIAPSNKEYVPCDLANWNCFLVSAEIVNVVGLIDNRYEHAMGDFDYSFRMKENSFNLVLAKNYIGYCENNGISNTFKDANLSRKQRLHKLFSPNGLPVKSWKYFTKKYYKNGAFRNFIVPYIKYIFCIIFKRECR